MPPRGGRGGGGRRGGGVKPGFARIGGMDIAHEVEPENNGRPQPSKTFPDYPGGQNPPQPRPSTARERKQVELQRHMISLLRRSPLFTAFTGSGQGTCTPFSSRFGPGATLPRIVGQQHGGSKRPHMATVAAALDPFTMMPHYSDRYDQRRRKMPRLDQQEIPPMLDFFPEELYSVIDPTLAKAVNGVAKGVKRERGNLDANEIEAAEADEAEATDASGDEDDDKKINGRGKKTKVVAEEGEDVEEGDEEVAEGEGEVDEEEEEDDDFEDDEEELAGDYNAEGYFDDGGDDGDDDMGDGDGGGGGDYD